MMLDPLRVKKSLRTGSKIFDFFFRPRSLFFDFGWLKHLDRLLNYQFRFSNFPNLPILNQMKLFSLEFGSKQRSTLFEKTFMVSTPGTCSFIQVLELFSFSFLPHRGEMTRPFFVRKCGNLSRTSSHCHPEIYQSGPSAVRGWCPELYISTGSFQSFDDFISGLWFLHF